MSKNIKWIKITTDIFDDEKIKLIDAMPDADAILVIWFKLLAQAGKSNEQGALLLNHKLAYTDEMLATIFNRKLSTIRLALEIFENLNMIERGDYIQITNWEKHQNIEGMEKIRLQNAERQRRFRENQKKLSLELEQDNVTVTLHNAIDIDKEEDKDIKNIYIGQKNDQSDTKILTNDTKVIKNDTSLNELFDTFWKSYPKKVGKQSCLNWFKRKKPNQELVDKMISKVNEYKQTKQWQTKQYIPNPLTWLNQGRWEDEIVIEKKNETSEEFEKLNFRTIGEK